MILDLYFAKAALMESGVMGLSCVCCAGVLEIGGGLVGDSLDCGGGLVGDGLVGGRLDSLSDAAVPDGGGGLIVSSSGAVVSSSVGGGDGCLVGGGDGLGHGLLVGCGACCAGSPASRPVGQAKAKASP